MGRWQGLEQTGPEAEKGFLNVWSNLGSLSPQQSQDCLHTQGISKPLPFSELSTQCLCVRVSVCVSVHLCVYACTKTGDRVKLSGEREQNDRRTTEQKAT